MIRGPTPRVAAVLTVAALVGLPIGVGAQQLRGVVVGPAGEPLPDQPVVLHRVGGEGGAFVATDTTAEDGRFTFDLRPDSAVYFAAIRYEGRLYIGPAVQAGGDPVTGYQVRVDPASEAGAVASGLAGPAATAPTARPASAPPPDDTGALVLVGLLGLAAASAFFFAAPGYRRRRTREALLDLARVENALADRPEADRASLEAERDRLRERLAPRR